MHRTRKQPRAVLAAFHTKRVRVRILLREALPKLLRRDRPTFGA